MRQIGLAVVVALVLFGAPLAGGAQQPGKVYRIGILSTVSASTYESFIGLLRHRLRDLGYDDGKKPSFRRDGSVLHSIVRVMTRQVLAQEVEADIMTMAEVDPELHRPVINSRNSWSFSTDGGRQSPFRVNAFELTSTAEDSHCVVVDLDSRRGHAPAANDFDHGATRSACDREAFEDVQHPDAEVSLARHARVRYCTGQQLTGPLHESCVSDGAGVVEKDNVNGGVGVAAIGEEALLNARYASHSEPCSI